MLIYLVALSLLSVATAFGATYLLVRKTTYAPYSALLSLVFFIPLLLTAITLIGYRMPVPLQPVAVFGAVTGGVCLTIFAFLRYKADVIYSLRSEWRASLLIGGLALAAMLFATPLLLASTSLAYIDWWNDELVNYAMLAHYFLGILRDPNYASFFESQTANRYGAELSLAAISKLTGKAPLLAVEVLSAFFKVSAIIAFAVSFELIRKEKGIRPIVAVWVNIGFAFSAILALNHILPFLASEAVTGCCILLSLGFLSNGINSRAIQVFLAIQLLFIEITYSEALPFLFLAAGILIVEAFVQRRREIGFGIVSVFGAAFLINPVLLAHRLDYMYRLRTVFAGYNVLGSPKDNLLDYVASALGLRFALANVKPLGTTLLTACVILALVALVCAFAMAAYRLRTTLLLAIPTVLILVNVLTGDAPEGLAYYRGYKTIAALSFYIFLAMGILAGDLLNRRSLNLPLHGVRAVLLTGMGVLVAGNMLATIGAVAWIKTVPTIYHEADFRQAFAAIGKPSGAAGQSWLVLSESTPAAIWDLMCNYSTFALPRVLDATQAVLIYHNNAPILAGPPLFPAAQTGAPLFRGRVLVPQVSSYPPNQEPQVFNVRTTLDRLSPDLRLSTESTLLVTPAFRLIEGTLTKGGVNSAPTSDGKSNLPPAIVSLAPQSGDGSTQMFTFTYTDPNGSADIMAALIQFYSEKTPQPYECYMSLTVPTNQLGIVLDGGTAWDVGTIASNRSLENHNCAVDVAHSSITASGNEFTLHLAMKFKRPFSGRKIVETTVADVGKLTTGWQRVGYWTVP